MATDITSDNINQFALTPSNLNTLAQEISSLGDGDYIYGYKAGAGGFSRIEKSVFMAGVSGGGQQSGSPLELTYDNVNHAFHLSFKQAEATPSLVVSTTTIGMSGSTKQATFSVSGANLTGSITIKVVSGGSYWTLAGGGAINANQIILAPTNGTLNLTTITVVYSGNSNSGCMITISGGGATQKSINANYSAAAIASLRLEPLSISLESASGTSISGTLKLIGANLTGSVSIETPDGFSVDPSTFSANTLNIAGQAGVSLVVTADTTKSSGVIRAISMDDDLVATASVEWSAQGDTPVVYSELQYVTYNDGLKVVNKNGNEQTPSAGSNYNYANVNIPSSAIYNGSALNVIAIGDRAFYNCSNMTSISIPSTVERIGKSAFAYTSLTECVIPDSVTSMGGGLGAVFSATPIERLKIGNGIETSSAHQANYTGSQLVAYSTTSSNSNSLKVIDLGVKFGYLHKQFIYDQGVTTLYLRYNGVVTVGSDHRTTIQGWFPAGTSHKIYVPQSLVNDYQNDSFWGQFDCIEAIPNG